MARVSMYSLVLFLHFLHGHDRQVAADDHRCLLHGARHRLRDQLQVGRAELVGHGLDAARVAVAAFSPARSRRRAGAPRPGRDGEGDSCVGVHSWLLRISRKSTALGSAHMVLITQVGVVVEHERLPRLLFRRAHALAVDPAEL